MNTKDHKELLELVKSHPESVCIKCLNFKDNCENYFKGIIGAEKKKSDKRLDNNHNFKIYMCANLEVSK